MKRILSVLLSIVMLASVSAVAVNAFAVVESQETTKTSSKITVEVNGSTTKEVSYTENPDGSEITFTYNGSGTLTGWEFDGMIEGEDYEIVSTDGNSITIRLLNGYDGDIDANAVVKKKSGGKKSPKTGAAAATGLAAAGAGAAILLALKKREDAE